MALSGAGRCVVEQVLNKSISQNPAFLSTFQSDKPECSSSQDRRILPPDCGLQRSQRPPLAGTQESVRKPACSPELQNWVDCADDLFNGSGSFYGFIVSNDNSYTEPYGYESLYEKINKKIDIRKIEKIKEIKGKKKRLIALEYGFIRPKEIYEWFADLVNRQNNTGILLTSPEGKSVIAQNGRFCNRKGKRSMQVQKVFKEGIGEISDCILFTLTTHQNEVKRHMPEHTNLSPVEYATVNIGEWISGFINRLRQWQRVRDIPWEFVGWTIEFQEGEKNGPDGHHGDPLKMHNGYVHVHMIFRGKWIGNIQEIAKLWPYCEIQGVDYMDKKKYEKKLRAEGKLKHGQHISGIRLINYVTAYVSKCSKAVIKKDGQIYVHKGYAWLAYTCGRMFNVAREYKRVGNKEKCNVKQYRTFQERYIKNLKEGWQYGGVQVYQVKKDDMQKVSIRNMGSRQKTEERNKADFQGASP